MAEKHHFLSLDESQESIPMWKAQKTSRNVAQIRHTGYNQKYKEISPISYGKSKRQTSLKFIQYKFQGHKVSRRGIVADQVQLGSITTYGRSINKFWILQIAQDSISSFQRFSTKILGDLQISRPCSTWSKIHWFHCQVADAENFCQLPKRYAQLPNICYLKSKISRIQEDPKGRAR